MSQEEHDASVDTEWMAVRKFSEHGDEEGFRELFERYREPVGRYARGITGRVETAEEVVAEAFARLAHTPPSPGRSFRAFLFTTVRRMCIDRLRRRQTAERLAPKPDGPDLEATTEHELLRAERRHQVRQAVASLPERHREVLLLYYGQDLTSEEVAEVLGCTGQQVRSRLSYARRLLRDALETQASGER